MLKHAWLMRLLLNVWPPLLFAGIRVIKLSDDFRFAKVRLKLSFYNKNAVGVHYGGSLFSMTDPFYMLMISARLGRDYIVWDKSADIDYISPGRGTVTAEFTVTDELIDEIIAKTEHGDKYLPTMPVNIIDQQGNLVATLNRTLYVRKKRRDNVEIKQ